MKITRIIPILAAVMILSTCGITKNAESEEEVSGAIASALLEKDAKDVDFTFEVTFVNPISTPSFHSSDGYTLALKDGVLNCDLPFIGTSDRALYGNEDNGIRVKDCPVEISVSQSRKSSVLKFAAATTSSSKVYFILEIWPDDTADLTCTSPSRSTMRYYGNLK